MKKFSLLVLFTASLFYTACTSTSDSPGWINSAPADNADYTYFTAVGSASGGNRGLAESEAQELIVSQITKYLGVRISSETTSEALDAYGEFKSKLTSVIKENSQARLSGLSISEKWVEKTEDVINVYLLAEYKTSELQAEKNRLYELFKEKQEAISGPEKEGDELFSSKQYYPAAVKYIEAALAASTSDLENADLKFERNITKARNSIDNVKIEIISGPKATYINEAFGEDFIVGLSQKGIPGEGLPVTVSYKELRENGRKVIRNNTLLSDEAGLVSFMPIAPSWVGREKITFFLDMRAIIEPLENVSFNLLQYVDGLEQAVLARSVSFEVEVLSKAVEIPTCVMIMDVDRSGNPLNKSDTAMGILSELTDAGFEVFMLPVDYRMTAVSDSALISLIQEQYGTVYQRFIFGTAEISSFEESGSSVIVKVTGKIKAVELDTGRILFSASEQKRARGGNNSATISAAFTSLGRMYGEKLVIDLP